jgi:hypothetical protein
MIALVVNLAIAIYLLLAKRLFGLHGGAVAEQAERGSDTRRLSAFEEAGDGTGID